MKRLFLMILVSISVGGCTEESNVEVAEQLFFGEWAGDAARYDLPPGMQPRSHSVSFVINGVAYILGGYLPSGQWANEMWRFNAADSTWQQAGALPYVPGSVINDFFLPLATSDGTYGYYYNPVDGPTIWRYDPVAYTWTNTLQYPETQNYAHGMVAMANRLYLFSSSSVHYYDFVFSNWEQAGTPPSIPSNYYYYCAAPDNQIVRVGNNLWNTYVHVYNIGIDLWQLKSNGAQSGARGAASVFVRNGKLYVAGGFSDNGQGQFPHEARVDEMDLSSGAWTEAPMLPCGTRTGAATFVVNDVAYLISGRGCSTSTSCVEGQSGSYWSNWCTY
ncbi:MAG: hypothetical protein H6601_10575 [Flavobacteriales bacterium]|nr:hypothetical protein [Flavobacteriales bacterium]MCB9205516.1 hypothetical protein [Flavobacteriales bacterium]